MKTVYTFIFLMSLCFSAFAQAKNTSSEVLDYRTVDGKIILEMLVNNVKADFVLDLSGSNAILPEYMEKLKIDSEIEKGNQVTPFRNKQVEIIGQVKIAKISLGNNIFTTDLNALVLKDEPYLRELGVAGVINASIFRSATITIDGRRQKITTSIPYRPPYMKLDYRVDLKMDIQGNMFCPVVIDGEEYSLLFDAWYNGAIAMSPDDFARFGGKKSTQQVMINFGYKAPIAADRVKVADKCLFVKNSFENVLVVENKSLKHSVFGNGILKEGILSVDVRRQKMYFQPYDLEKIEDEVIAKESNVKIIPGKLNPITGEYFLEYIFDYRKEEDFVLKGDKPVIIDFWASWCGPCMSMLPFMEKLAEKYKDQIIFYKVNADVEKELCRVYDVVALPTFFFIPKGGKPIIEIGAKPENFEQIILEKLLPDKR
ncbi:MULTISPECIES: thioredoxin domain-containing protein [Butyricimonas]|uniref:thioredoxin domain-containing protein n=1 Tax=Butyricimonas TaxID=574697 RepID=UPI0007FB4879|nr:MULTISPECIES: thioredoxin domain-containing protein [Butyricimonas]